jgi:hypothetical protein
METVETIDIILEDCFRGWTLQLSVGELITFNNL